MNIVGIISEILLIIFWIVKSVPFFTIGIACLNIGLSLGIFYFHSKRKYKYAYFLVGVAYNLSIVLGALIIGKEAEMEYLLIVLNFVMAYLVFENRAHSILYLGFCIFLFVFLKIYFHYHPAGLIEFSDLYVVSLMNGIAIFLVIFFLAETMMRNRINHIKELDSTNAKISLLNINLEEKVVERTQKIEQQSKELAQSHQSLRDFAFIAAHDLREPVRNIVSFSGLLSRDVKAEEFKNIEIYEGYIHQSAQKITAITNAIVKYVELTNKVRRDELVDINQLLEVIKQDLDKLYPTKKTTFIYADMPNIIMDRELAYTLWACLLDNAYLYTKEEDVNIEIEAKQVEQSYVFSIRDWGVGIPISFQEEVFRLFQRLDKKEAVNHIGTGLAISKKIVEIYKGEIGFSFVEKGTKVNFKIGQ